VFFAVCVSAIHAADSVPAPSFSPAPAALAPDSARTATPGKTLWQISLTSLAVSNAMDVQSSWGKHELNGTLAGPSGTFGSQGTLLKLGFQGGLVAMEYLLARRHPSARLYRVLSIVNFGASAAIAGAAAHNYSVPPPGR